MFVIDRRKHELCIYIYGAVQSCSNWAGCRLQHYLYILCRWLLSTSLFSVYYSLAGRAQNRSGCQFNSKNVYLWIKAAVRIFKFLGPAQRYDFKLIIIMFKKPSKTAVVLIAGVTISGTPCLRHFIVPFGAEAP